MKLAALRASWKTAILAGAVTGSAGVGAEVLLAPLQGGVRALASLVLLLSCFLLPFGTMVVGLGFIVSPRRHKESLAKKLGLVWGRIGVYSVAVAASTLVLGWLTWG